MNQLVTIIIPTFNRSTLIGETLRSIALQHYENWECIIVDDHSTDNTKDVVAEFILKDARFQYHSRPESRLKGANACRNYGFEISKGQYINWFDSDDIMDPDFISEKIAALMNSNVDAVISKKADFIVSREKITAKEQRTYLSNDTLTDFLNSRISWFLPDMMWNRDFLVGKQLFDEALLAGQDRDFHARMLLQNPKLQVVDRYLTYCRIHQNNITSKINNVKNTNLKVSHLHSVHRLIVLLETAGKLNQSIKLRYFKSMMQYVPYVINQRKDTIVLLRLLKRLSFSHRTITIGWIQVFFAYFSLRIFGMGARLLK